MNEVKVLEDRLMDLINHEKIDEYVQTHIKIVGTMNIIK